MFKGKKCWCMFLSVLLVVTIIMPMNPTIVYATDEYDTLREKYKTKYTGYDPADPYDPDDQYIKISLENLDDKVEKYWPAMNSSYCWDDVMVSSETAVPGINQICSRLHSMALGWATYGSAYYGNAELLNDTINGLEWFYNNRYNENSYFYTNPQDWWYWEIGIAFALDKIVVMLYDHLSSEQITNYMNAVNHYSPEVYTSSIIPNSHMVGANRISKCEIVGLRAIIVKDPVKLQEASDGLNDVLKYTTGDALSYTTDRDGFYTDGSFIQHGYYPYAGSYGKILMSDISDILWLLSGSAWDNNSPDKGNVYQWIFDTFNPNMFKGEIFASVRGRDISRPASQASTGFDIISSLFTLIEITSNQYADEFKSIAKYHLQNGYQDSYLRTCGIWYVNKAKNILDDTQVIPAPELIGNYQFYNQDRIMHRSQGWAFDIAMHSNRIASSESFSGENLKGWYTADGMTYLYTKPSDYAFNFWPTVDPHRLPGITVDRYTSRPNAGSGHTSPNPWAGGVSLEGKYGSAGMDFRQHDSQATPAMDLSVKKSWFMFDDEIVSLGTGINSKSGRIIETVVDNRLLNSQGNNPLTVNGIAKHSAVGWSETMDNVSWIHLDGTGGYVFPDSTSLNGLRERREGSYYDINQLYYNMVKDEFNKTVQGSAWTWVREDSDRHSLSGATLDITTCQGSLEGTVNTAKNIMLTGAPQYDFYSDTKLDFSPSVDGQEAGLIFYADDDNYVYISRKYIGSRLAITAVNESGGTVTRNAFGDTYGTTVYFRIEKCGNDYLLYASSDGQMWGVPLYTYTNSMAGSDGVNYGLKMGLFAQNGDKSSAPEITASYDYFSMKLVRNYMTLWKDHGVNPADDTYSYITLPNKTAQEVGAYSNNPDVSILRNDKEVQAVKENTLEVIGANFWSPGNVSYITAYDQASVMVKDLNNQLEIAVSDPTHNRSEPSIKLELCKPGISVVSSDPTVTVLQMSPTIILEVDITGAGATKGKTHNITIAYDSLAPTLLPRTMIQLKPVADAYVRDSSTDTHNGTALVVAAYNTGIPGSGNTESYIKFDLSSISNELEIESAKLYLLGSVPNNERTGTADVTVYGVDDDSWTEKGVTWDKKPDAGIQLGTIHADYKNEWKEIDMTSYVNSQYTGDKLVSILLKQDQVGLYTKFYSREYSSYPYLMITAASASKLISPEADSTVIAGDFSDTNYGSCTTIDVKKSDKANTNRHAYIKFDLSSISGEVASARLYAYGRVNDSGGTEINNMLYSVDDDSWTESGITWNEKPDPGQYLSAVHMTSQSEWRGFDATSYVRAQCAGDKKASFVIIQDADLNGLFSQYRSKEHSSKKPCLQITTYKKIVVDLPVEADSTVTAGDFSDTNYGSGTTIDVKKSDNANTNRQAYIKFDLSPIEGQVLSAKLYARGRVTDGTEIDNKLYSVDDDSWTENGITWNEKPDPGQYLSTVHMTSQSEWRECDVTSYIQAQCAGDKKASFVILQDVSGEGLYTLYRSKEQSDGPYLKVTYLEADTTAEITSFDAIADISAGPAGSAIYADAAAVTAVLPASVKANGNAVEVPVTKWVDTDGYNPNIAGSYTFTAILGAIPSGYANTGNHTAAAEAVVAAPGAPALQSAVAGDGHVKITWSEVAGSTGYEVYASTVSNSYPVPVTTVAGLVYNYDVTGLTNGTTYYFAVKAVNPGGNSDYSNELSATPQVAAPGAPVIQSAVAGDGHVNITWSEVAGSTGYEVYASTVSNSYSVPVTTVAGLVYDYDVTGLTNGTTYYFAVKAVNPGGSSDYSNELSAVPQVAAPGAPVIQSAVAGDGHVNITWSEVAGSTGYEVYTSTVSNSYSVPVTTVAGLVYDYDVTGLINGTTYYFTVKAINAGGDSPHSAEVSATPRTVPGAPVNVTAAAGDGQAAVSFAAPSDNGGSPVTEYIVTSNPGAITARGAGTSIIVAGLSNGTNYTFTVRAVNAAGSSMESAASNTVTPYAPSSEDDEDDSEDDSTPPANTPEQEQTMPAGAGIETLVNGNAVTMATAATTVIEGKTVTTISIDDKRVEEILQNQGDNALLTLSAENDADVIVSRLNAQTVRRMEAAGAALEIRTANVIYTLPAAQISIDNVLSQLGGQVEPEDITVNIKVSEPPEDIIKIIEDTADKNNYQIVVKPVEFEITCTSGDKTVNISKFNGYIERMIAIPEGVDPARITTGVVLNPDGTFSHVPTVITVIDGKYYAKISSVTNSTYSVIRNLKSFKDVEAHWAKDAVNDMGSRLIINGVSEEMFEPERNISRAEFMMIVVKALGLMKPGAGKDVFGDVAKAAWYYDAVSAAYEYGIIAGYENSKFEPDCEITREQAMVMIARAMKTANIKVEFDGGEEDKLLENYIDADKSADYAKSSIAACIKAGIVNGRNDNLVAPKDYITRAEAAIIVRRLLQKSNLI